MEAATEQTRRQRVLVVEDTADIRELLGQILGDEGYDVVGVSNGAEALDALNGGQFQLILLDLMMPVMNGFEMLGRLAEKNEGHPPIVAMSAFERFRGEARQLGAESFLSKPVDIDRLLGEVERVLTVQQAVAGAARVVALARAGENAAPRNASLPVTQRLAEWLQVDRASYRPSPTPGESPRSSMLILGDASTEEDVPGGLYVRLSVGGHGVQFGILELADANARDLIGEELSVAQFVAGWLAAPHAPVSGVDLDNDRWGERLTELLTALVFERARQQHLGAAIAAVQFAASDVAAEHRILRELREALGPEIDAGWRRPTELIAIARALPQAAERFERSLGDVVRSWSPATVDAGAVGMSISSPGVTPLVSEVLPAVVAAAERVRNTRGWGLERVYVPGRAAPAVMTPADMKH